MSRTDAVAGPTADDRGADGASHITIRPSVLYVGTPVLLLSTRNADGSANLAPASSYWALEQMLVLGLEADGHTVANLLERPELTVNFPSPELWTAVERLAGVTGRHPVPAAKADRYTWESEKFEVAGLDEQESELVSPPRVRECRLQFEARVARATPAVNGGYYMVEAEVVRVHADPAIVVPGTDHIDPRLWRPTVYSFRHYFDLGAEVGWRSSSPTGRRDPGDGA